MGNKGSGIRGQVCPFLIFAKITHRRRKAYGPLFRGRYKALLIEDGEYLWIVIRYLNRRPIETRLTEVATAFDLSYSTAASAISRLGMIAAKMAQLPMNCSGYVLCCGK